MSVWLDDISRDRLRTGNLQELADGYHVVGVTSNPTIFAHAVDHGDAYDGQLADLKTRGVSVEEAGRGEIRGVVERVARHDQEEHGP